MQRFLGICEIFGAVVIFVLAILLSGDVSSLYRRSDAQQLSDTLKGCSDSTKTLAENYELFHKELLPQIKERAKDVRNDISKLESPCEFLYSIACFNMQWVETKKSFPYVSTKTYYPFEKFQEPIRTFRYYTIPAFRTTLENFEIVIDKFQNGTSNNICKTMPEIAESMDNASKIIKQQQDLNRRIAIYIIIIGSVCSLLLLLSGICLLRAKPGDAGQRIG